MDLSTAAIALISFVALWRFKIAGLVGLILWPFCTRRNLIFTDHKFVFQEPQPVALIAYQETSETVPRCILAARRFAAEPLQQEKFAHPRMLGRWLKRRVRRLAEMARPGTHRTLVFCTATIVHPPPRFTSTCIMTPLRGGRGVPSASLSPLIPHLT